MKYSDRRRSKDEICSGLKCVTKFTKITIPKIVNFIHFVVFAKSSRKIVNFVNFVAEFNPGHR